MAVTFKTYVQAMTPKATAIPVPTEYVEALGGGKKPRVLVTINGYTYRSTIQVYAGESGMSFHAEDREAAGVKAGDDIEVTIELDLEPRTVEVPDDLSTALSNIGALETFEALSYSKRKEYVRQVTDAKTRETRDRRIAKVVADFSNS